MSDLIVHIKPRRDPERAATINDLVGAALLLFNSFSQLSTQSGWSFLIGFNICAGTALLIGNALPLVSKTRFHHVSRYLKVVGGLSLVGSGIDLSPGARKMFHGPTILTGLVLILLTLFEKQIKRKLRTKFRKRAVVFSESGVNVRYNFLRRHAFPWDEIAEIALDGPSLTVRPRTGKSISATLDPEESNEDEVRQGLRSISYPNVTIDVH